MVSYCYDAWGRLLKTTDNSSAGIATLNPFRYKGYFYDAETGFYYSNSRYYDPEVGRFISADTTDVLTKDKTSITPKNLYAYANNNPVNWQDDSGRFPVVAVNIALNVGVNLVSTWAEAKINGEKMTLEDGIYAAAMGTVEAVFRMTPVISAVVNGLAEFAFSEQVEKETNMEALVDAGIEFAVSWVGITRWIGEGLPKTKTIKEVDNIYNTLVQIPFKIGEGITVSELQDMTKKENQNYQGKTRNYSRTWYKEREM